MAIFKRDAQKQGISMTKYLKKYGIQGHWDQGHIREHEVNGTDWDRLSETLPAESCE